MTVRIVDSMDARCPTCRGPIAVVGARAWCLQTYAAGGCGSHWTLGARGWVLRRDRNTA